MCKETQEEEEELEEVKELTQSHIAKAIFLAQICMYAVSEFRSKPLSC